MTNKGFSLIEVLISIVLLSFITLAVISNTDENFALKERVVSEDKDRLKIYTALSMMEWDFSHIYSPLYFSEKFDMQKLASANNNGNQTGSLYQIKENLQRSISERYRNNTLFYMPSAKGVPVPRFKQPDKFTFEFFTNSNRRVLENSKESNYSWIVYTLEDPSQKDIEYAQQNSTKEEVRLGSNLVRYQITKDPFRNEDIDFSKQKSQVIMENVDELQFLFWNTKREEFTVLQDIEDGKGWIQAMKVVIKYRNLYDQPQTLEKIFRPIWPLYNPLKDPNAPSNSSTGQGQNSSSPEFQAGGANGN